MTDSGSQTALFSRLSNTSSVQEAHSLGTALLADGGSRLARMETRLLLAHALGREISPLITCPHATVSKAERDRFVAFLRRRCLGEPVSRIKGERGFWSLDFHISPATFDPRPDSETLVETVLLWLKDKPEARKIMDLGTGSGCLVLSLLHECEKIRGLGTDISPEALAVAMKNAARHNLLDRASFVEGVWCDTPQAQEGGWDVILSNPPYIKLEDKEMLAADVLNYDPHRALFAADEGLSCYRAIIRQAPALLRKGGLLAFEVGQGQAKTVNKFMAAGGLIVFDPVQDLGGIDRVCWARKP